MRILERRHRGRRGSRCRIDLWAQGGLLRASQGMRLRRWFGRTGGRESWRIRRWRKMCLFRLCFALRRQKSGWCGSEFRTKIQYWVDGSAQNGHTLGNVEQGDWWEDAKTWHFKQLVRINARWGHLKGCHERYGRVDELKMVIKAYGDWVRHCKDWVFTRFFVGEYMKFGIKNLIRLVDWDLEL